MARVPPAPLAVLAQGDAVRVVALGLLGLVVPALALLAGEGDGDPDISAGHGRRAPRVWGSLQRRAKENLAPARGRQVRIARPRVVGPCRRRPSCPESPTCTTTSPPACGRTWPLRARPTRRRCSRCTDSRSTGTAGDG